MVNISTAALEVVDGALMVCGLQGYMNNARYSLGRHLRDIHSARLVIGNEPILVSIGQGVFSGRSPVAMSV